MLYGQHGVGKSTWAADAPTPIFLNIEDGIGDINCASTPKLNSYAEVVSAIQWLNQNTHEFKTVVIDTIDWLEQFVLAEVAKDLNKAAFSLIKFGDGNGPALKKMMFLLDGLEALRRKGMGIILLAHARIVRHENPETAAYDRYEPDLHKVLSSTIQEWCDEVLFASFRVFIRTEDEKFGGARALAIGGKERFIRTNESAAAIAKNRAKLPDELPMNWAAYVAALPRPTETSAPISPAPSSNDIPAVVA